MAREWGPAGTDGLKRSVYIPSANTDLLADLRQEFPFLIRKSGVSWPPASCTPNRALPESGQQRRLLLGLFHGVPTTKKSIFDLPTGPDYIVALSEEY